MASFNLTAQLNISGPANLKPVISNIRKQLSSINPNINININTANLASSSKSLQDLNTNLKNITVSATSAADAMRRFGASVGSVNMSSLPKNMSAATQQSQQLQQQQARTAKTIKESGDSMADFGRQSALAIRRFAAFTLVTGIIYKFTGALSSASDEFMKFNKQMVQLSQVTGTSLPGLAGLEREITSLSTSLGVSSSSLIDVSSTLAQAGLSAQETEQALKALAKSTLAPSFDDLNSTVEGSIALMRQFSISTAELDGALGSINAVAAKFAVEAGDIITAIQRTGGVFAASSKGVSEGTQALNEFIAVFTSIRATTRESAETIATGLRTIFTRLQRRETIDTLKQFGVQLTDLEGKFVGPYEAVKRLSQGLAGLDTRDIRFSSIIEELGGFRQVGKVIPLLQQFATAEKALGVAQRGQGSLTADAAKAQQALAIQMTKVQEEFISLVRKIGSSNEFQTMVKLALNLASAFISVADSAKHALPAITALLAVKGTIGAFRFASGFMGGMRGGGGGRGMGAGDRMSGAPKGFANGGKIQRFSEGGVPVALEAGEIVFSGPETVKKYGGPAALGRYNRTGERPPNLNLARGGGVFMVPGSGRGDNFKTTLPVGSFVIKRQSVRAAAANGGRIGYAAGGSVKATVAQLAKQSKGGAFIRNYQQSNKDVVNNPDLAVSASIVRDNIELTDKDFEYLKAKASGKKGRWATLNKTVWADGFEKIARRRKGTGWKRTARTGEFGGVSAPVDLIKKNGSSVDIAEVKFTHENNPVSDLHALSKLFRFKILASGNDPKKMGFTENRDTIPLGSMSVIQPSNKDKFLQMFSPNYKGSKTKRRRAAIGGLIQRLSGGTDEPLTFPGRASLLKTLLTKFPDMRSINALIGGEDARKVLGAKNPSGPNFQKLMAEYGKVTASKTAKKAKSKRLASTREFGVLGLRGPSGTSQETTPLLKSKTKGTFKPKDVSVQKGVLSGFLSKRLEAIARKGYRETVAQMAAVLAERAGTPAVSDRKALNAIIKKTFQGGGLGQMFESAVAAADSRSFYPTGKINTPMDLPKGSGVAGLFGVKEGIPTDVTVNTEENKTAQMGRFLRDKKLRRSRKALGGQVQRLAEGGTTLKTRKQLQQYLYGKKSTMPDTLVGSNVRIGGRLRRQAMKDSSQTISGFSPMGDEGEHIQLDPKGSGKVIDDYLYYARGGQVQRLAGGGRASRSPSKLVPSENVGQSPLPTGPSNKLGSEFYDLLDKSGLPKWAHKEISDFLKINKYSLQEAQGYIKQRQEERNAKLSQKTNVSALAESLKTQPAITTENQRRIADEQRSIRPDPQYAPPRSPFERPMGLLPGMRRLAIGGEVQRLVGGTSSGPLRNRKRITGLLDVDKLRDSKRAREAMQKLGFYNPKQDTYDVSGYRDSLANAALAERQKKGGPVDYMAADLGSPGAGKSTYGLKGKGSKRYIETIEDLEEMIASGNRVSIRNAMASLDEDKIRHLSQYDRIRVLSSTTPEEMKELKGRLKNRTRQGKESIAATGVDTSTQFGRKHTIKAQSSEDTEAMLRFKDENGKQIIDESKIATYSIATDRRKQAHEVPMVRHEALNVIKGGFGPTTREGHVEGLFKKAKKDKKLMINVGPDESLTDEDLQEILSGSGKAHGARTVIFDRKTRKKMVEKSLKDENLDGYVSTSGDGFGLASMFKVGKDPKTGQAIYTQPDKKKSTIVIGEDRAGSEQKYRDMGYDNVQIVPRGAGAASASKVRDDMFEKRDFSGVTPSVRKMLEEASQRGVFENTLNTLPKVVQHVQKKAQAKIASIDLDLDKLLASVPGGRLTEAFTKQNPELAKEIKRLRAKKSDIKGSAKRSDIHAAMRKLKSRYPEKYGFDMGDEEESSFKPMRQFKGQRFQTAAIGGLIQRFARGTSSPISAPGEIPIMAQEGEFVLNKHATGQIGPHTLKKLNRGGKVAIDALDSLPKYHTGGMVQKLAGGTPKPLSPAVNSVPVVKSKAPPRLFPDQVAKVEKDLHAKISSIKDPTLQEKLRLEIKSIFGGPQGAQEIFKFFSTANESQIADSMAKITAITKKVNMTLAPSAAKTVSAQTPTKPSNPAPVAKAASLTPQAPAQTKLAAPPPKPPQTTPTNDPRIVANSFWDGATGQGRRSLLGVAPNADMPGIHKKSFDQLSPAEQNAVISKVTGTSAQPQQGTTSSKQYSAHLNKVAVGPKPPAPPPTSQQKQEAYRKQLTSRAIQSGVKIPALPPPPKKYAIGGMVQKFAVGTSRPISPALSAKKPEKQFGKIGLRSSGKEITAFYFKNNTREGFVTANEIEKGIWNIGLSKATKGYGPRLYDAVMEAVTARGGVLTSHRGKVSGHAKKVWDVYANERSKPDNKYGSQVTKVPLDPKHHTIDKDPNSSINHGYQQQPNIIKGPDIVDMNDKKYDKMLDHMKFEFLRANGGTIERLAGGNLRPLSRKPSLAPKPQIQNNELNTIQAQINNLELRRQALDSHTKTGFFGGKSNPYQKELHEVEDEIARLSSTKHRLSKSLQSTTTRSSIPPVPARLLPSPITARQATTPKRTTVVPQSRPASVPTRSSIPPRLPTQVAPKTKPQIKNNELEVIQSQINDLKHREATLNSHTKTSFFGGKSNPYQAELHKLQDEIDRLSQRKYRLEQSSAPSRFAIGGEIPIMAQEGEFVLNKHAAGQIGPNTLKKLNRGGRVAMDTLEKLPKYHTGGSVQKFKVGGIVGKSFKDLESPNDALNNQGDKSNYVNQPIEERKDSISKIKDQGRKKVRALKAKLAEAVASGDAATEKQLRDDINNVRTQAKSVVKSVMANPKTDAEHQARTAATSPKGGGRTAAQMRADLEAKNAALPPDQRKNLHKSLDTVTAEASAPKPVVPKPGDPGFVGPVMPGVAEARAKQQAASLEKQREAAKKAGFSTEVGTSGTRVVNDSDLENFKKSRRQQKENARTPASNTTVLGASQDPIIKQQNRDATKQTNAQQSRGPGAIPGFLGGAVGGAMSGASKGATVARGKNGGIVSTVVGGAIGGTAGLVGGAVKGALGSEKSNRIRSMQYGVAADKLRARAGDMAKGGSSSSGTLAVLNKAFAPLVSTASKLNSGMSSLHTGAAKAAQSLSSAGGGLTAYGNNVKNASGIMAKLYAATSPAINGLKKLGSSVVRGADSAIGSLGGMQKVNENGKQVWRNAPGGIMGRVGGFLGMGGGGGTMGDDGVTRGPDGKRKKGFGGGGRRGGGGGMGGMGMYAAEMGLSMAGSAAVEQLAAASGGQKTKQGREIATIGGSAVSGASMGMMMGSMFGPMGMAAGAAIGGIGGALYGQSQMPEIERQAASQKRMESIEKAGGKMSQNLAIANNAQVPESVRKEAEARAQADFETISSNSRAESVAGAKKKERTWAEWSVGADASSAKTVEERVESAQPAADKAKEMLSYKMQKTGKNLEELESSMPKAEFDKLTEAIALTDKGYQSLLESVHADGKVTDAEAATLERARKAAMEREGADVKAAGEAAKTAKQNASMTQAMQKVTTSFQRMATAMTAAAARADKVMENGKLGIDAVDNPMAAVQQGQISQSADILSNPEAYSMNEMEGALRQNASMMGPNSEAMVQSAMMPRKLEQSLGTAMQEAKAGGQDDPATRDTVKKAVLGTVSQAFGGNLPEQMKKNIDEFVTNFKGDIRQLDFNDIIKAIPEFADNVTASKEVLAAFQAQAASAGKAIGMIGDAAQKSAGKGQEIRNRDADTYSTVANSTLAFRRATGEKISYQADAGVRNQARATRLGTSAQVAASPKAMLDRYNQLNKATGTAAQAQQQITEANRPALLSGDQNQSDGAIKAMESAARTTAEFAQATQQARDEIMNLPNDIKENIGGIMQELQDVMQERAAKIGAAGGLMEKILTSTPKDLRKMGNTFNNLNQTLSGKGVSFEQSQSANTAYNQARRQGGSHMQAQRAAQEAYAQESGDTLSMAKELAPLLGAVDPEAQNKMMGSVYENMFAARGMDTSKMMVGDKSMKDYIEMMKAGGKKDPKVEALQNALSAQQSALQAANDAAKQLIAQEAEALTTKTGAAVLDAMLQGAEAVRVAVAEGKQIGITPPGEAGKSGAGGKQMSDAQRDAAIKEEEQNLATAVKEGDVEQQMSSKHKMAVLGGSSKEEIAQNVYGKKYKDMTKEEKQSFDLDHNAVVGNYENQYGYIGPGGNKPPPAPTPVTPPPTPSATGAQGTANGQQAAAPAPATGTGQQAAVPVPATATGQPAAPTRTTPQATGAATPAPTVYGASQAQAVFTPPANAVDATEQSKKNLDAEQEAAKQNNTTATNAVNINNASGQTAPSQPQRQGPMSYNEIREQKRKQYEQSRYQKQQQYLSGFNEETRKKMEEKLGSRLIKDPSATSSSGQNNQPPGAAPSATPRGSSSAPQASAPMGAPVAAPRTPQTQASQNQGAGVLSNNGFEAFASKLDTLLTKLAEVNIPTEIRLTSEQLGVNITLNGAEVMNNLGPALASNVMKQAGEQLARYDQATTGEGAARSPGVMGGQQV